MVNSKGRSTKASTDSVDRCFLNIFVWTSDQIIPNSDSQQSHQFSFLSSSTCISECGTPSCACCQAQPKSQLSWAEVAALWPIPTTTHHPTPTTPWGLNEAIYWPDFNQTLKVGFWDHPQQSPTVMVIFVQATFVLETFVHIRNNSVVTDPILTKL